MEDRPAAAPADFSHIALSYVIPVYFNQRDTAALSDLLTHYARCAPAMLDRVQFIVVDDGSPVRVSVPPELDLNLLLLRINEDKPWNQPGARNLGVTYARSNKVFLTDIDHEIPEATLGRLIAMNDPGRRIYRLKRRDADGTFRTPHKNTFLLSRGRFLELYGYDEEFCGAYGFDDLWFVRWQRYHGSRCRYLPRRYFVKLRAVDESTAYHSLARDTSRNADLYRLKRRACEHSGPQAGHSRQFLRFTWSIVVDRHRPLRLPRRSRAPFWQLAWRWNKLVSGRQ